MLGEKIIGGYTLGNKLQTGISLGNKILDIGKKVSSMASGHQTDEINNHTSNSSESLKIPMGLSSKKSSTKKSNLEK